MFRSGIIHALDLVLTRALTLMVSVTKERLSYLLRLLTDPSSVWRGRRCRHSRECGKSSYMPPAWLVWISACRSCWESLKRYINDSLNLAYSVFMESPLPIKVCPIHTQITFLLVYTTPSLHACVFAHQRNCGYRCLKPLKLFTDVNNLANKSSPEWNDAL